MYSYGHMECPDVQRFVLSNAESFIFKWARVSNMDIRVFTFSLVRPHQSNIYNISENVTGRMLRLFNAAGQIPTFAFKKDRGTD
jgi:hypothetical protein